MIEAEMPMPRAAPFSPLVRAVLESFAEGVVVFDADGNMTYANGRAQSFLNSLADGQPRTAETLMPLLARLGGRIARLRAGNLALGEAVYLPGEQSPHSLAERERQAIVNTLDQTQWKLAETAKLLGISRTTLWRRLKAYGLHRDKRGRWASPAR